MMTPGSFHIFLLMAREASLSTPTRSSRSMPVKGSWGKTIALRRHMRKRLSGNVNIRMRGQELPRFGSCCETINGKVFPALTDLPGTLQPPVFQEGCGHEHMINSASRNSS